MSDDKKPKSMNKDDLLAFIAVLEKEAESQAEALGAAAMRISELERAAESEVDEEAIKAEYQGAIDELTGANAILLSQLKESEAKVDALNEKIKEIEKAIEDDEIIQDEKQKALAKKIAKQEVEVEMKYCKGSFSMYPASDFAEGSDYSRTFLKSKAEPVVDEKKVVRRPSPDRVMRPIK